MKIFLIDDSKTMRNIQKNALATLGHKDIGEAGNGKEALDTIEAFKPDLILCDWNMPVMDGIEATRRIKETLPDTIVIGLSVQTIAHVGHEMREAGAVAFLNKEAAVEDLYQTIQTARKELLSRS